MPVIRLLPYLLAALIVIVSLAFATMGDSLLVQYDKIRYAFGDGRVVDGVAGLLQVALLLIPVAGVTLTLALVGRRLGAVVWRWSEGKPILRAGLSSARFGVVIVAVAAVGVALFTWLPNGNRPTSDGHTLKDALEKASSQVASLLGAESGTASAEEADSGASEPKSIFEMLTEPILPQRGEERDSTPAPQGSSSERASEKASSPSQQSDDGASSSDEASSSNPVTLAPKGSVPTVTEAPPMSTEEPATAPTTTPTEEPPAAAQEPLPPVTEEEPLPPPATEEPPPIIVQTPPPVTEPPPTKEPPDTAPEPPSEKAPAKSPADAPSADKDRSLIPIPMNCTTSPGDEPGSTTTHCSTD